MIIGPYADKARKGKRPSPHPDKIQQWCTPLKRTENKRVYGDEKKQMNRTIGYLLALFH